MSACHDADGDPTALLVAEETRSALLVEGDLPSFPELVGAASAQGELSGAMDLWLGSWDTTGPSAADQRLRAYEEGADILAGSLGRDGVAAAHVRLGEALAAAERLQEGDLPAEMGERMDEATDLHARATRLLDDGRDADALTAVLQGTDALRTVGPMGVARVLISRAEARLETVREDGTTDPTAIERADRLVRGARMALEDERWSRAIRRAFYACQVLGVAPR